jgi:hypothetical protein
MTSWVVRGVLRMTPLLAIVLFTVGFGGCRDSDPTASEMPTLPARMRPSVQTCARLWNVPGNRENHHVVATQPFTKAAVYSWRIKTGDYGCSVAVVAIGGRWLTWANTVRALNRQEWGPPVKGRTWGADTPDPLPRLNATVLPTGAVKLR